MAKRIEKIGYEQTRKLINEAFDEWSISIGLSDVRIKIETHRQQVLNYLLDCTVKARNAMDR